MNSKMMGKLELLGRIAEMKRIYTVIESSIKENACVVVASALQGEGKSTLAAGLALAASKAKGRRVLAVDLNWYGPVLHSIFGVEEGENRKSYHDGGAIERIIRKTAVENIDILPAMRSDYEVPETDQNVSIPFAELLLKARKDYDVVIVDTAPAFPTNQRMIDPVEICKSSDGVVVVTLTNKTPRQELKRVCSAIETVGAHIMGIVANHWQNPLY